MMTELIKAAILGIVEGLTEFLPVSSTGHLIIVNQFITFNEHFTKMFDVIIQLGAILSVVVYFWNKLIPFGKNKSELESKQTLDLWKKTIIGVLPFIVVAALFHDEIETVLFNPVTVAIALFVGGVFLIMIENRKKTPTINSLEVLSYKTAFLIGFFQCLALIPGTSRSAATIIGAMLLGTSRKIAGEFSFFMAVPIMFAASGFSLLKLGFKMTTMEMMVLATGFIVSFFVAWMVISVFMNFISKRDFKPFAYYRIVLGILIALYYGIIK